MKAYLCGTLEGEYVCCSVTVRSKIVTEFFSVPFPVFMSSNKNSTCLPEEKKACLFKFSVHPLYARTWTHMHIISRGITDKGGKMLGTVSHP